MSTRVIAIIAIGLWVLTVLAGVYIFVSGQTRPSEDGRTAILLQPSERDMVLSEMRELLSSVQGVIGGLSPAGRAQAAAAARRAGTEEAVDIALMAKLPLEFKQLGMAMHEGFDELAAAIDQGESSEQVLNRLSGLLQRCVACHATYRIAAGNER